MWGGGTRSGVTVIINVINILSSTLVLLTCMKSKKKKLLYALLFIDHPTTVHPTQQDV